MKQGTGHSMMGATKVEPKSRGVNVSAVADIGIQSIRTRSQQMYVGRGIEAPMAGCTIHKAGSQGKR